MRKSALESGPFETMVNRRPMVRPGRPQAREALCVLPTPCRGLFEKAKRKARGQHVAAGGREPAQLPTSGLPARFCTAHQGISNTLQEPSAACAVSMAVANSLKGKRWLMSAAASTLPVAMYSMARG